MMSLFILLSQTVELDRVQHSGIAIFETNEYGHFLYDRSDHVFHWTLAGKLIYSVTNKPVILLHPVRGGYAQHWIDEKANTYGMELITPTGVVIQNDPGMHTPWLFQIGGKLYGAPDIWGRNEDLIIPIEVRAGLFPTKKRKPFFKPAQDMPSLSMDRDFQRVWVVEAEQGKVYAMTPLSNTILLFENSRHIKNKVVNIPWVAYKADRHTLGMDWKPWALSFNRVTHFGDTGNALVISVDQRNESTLVYFLTPDGENIIRQLPLTGWCRKGIILSGTDGFNAWVFDPAKLSVTAERP